MSVIGIDFGNESCFVAVGRGGGIETVDNDYSLRNTSSTVAFGEKQRILGVGAKNQLTTNIKNTITGFKRLLGRKFEDPRVQDEIRQVPFGFRRNQHTGGVEYKVKYLNEDAYFAPEQIAAMLFTKLRETTEAAIQAKVTDCVISVPAYYTDSERRALLGATQIAGLNVLRLLNETSATALCYGIYKEDLPALEEKAKNVVFVDCGHSALQISICAFNRGKLKVLACTTDPYLGGRDFDRILANHFCAEFRTKYNIDVANNPRAYVRLLTEVERIKKQMSANATKLPLNIECLMDDKDVTSHMCRADFENMCASLFQRVEVALQRCLQDSELQTDQIHSVEIVGGSSRIPAIKQLITNVFLIAPSTTLNQDEAVSRGCALQCAILSPLLKVRDFSITDVQPYAIKVSWDEGGPEISSSEIFPIYHPAPFSRMLTIYRASPFNLKAFYSSPVPVASTEIGNFKIGDIDVKDPQGIKIKIKARINLNGIFNVCNATAYEIDKSVVEEESMETETTTASNGEKPVSTENSDNLNQGPESSENSTDVTMIQSEVPAAEDGSEKKKKQHYKTRELPITETVIGYGSRDIDIMTEAEGKMKAQDKQEKERVDAKNALEEFVYLLREKIENEYRDVIEENCKTQLLENLRRLENWLYEDGSEEARNIYNEKLDALKKTVEPIQERRKDAIERPNALREFDISLQLCRKIAEFRRSNEPRYNHLDPLEVENFNKVIEENQMWLDRAREVLHSVQSHMDSPIKASEITQQRLEFERLGNGILHKPRPKVEPPKEEQMQSESATSTTANDSENNIPKPTASKPQQDMEVE